MSQRTDTTKLEGTSSPKESSSKKVELQKSKQSSAAPSVFDFTNYREYIKEFFKFKKLTNSSYSASQFIRKAGLNANSRGYLKLITEGKRNLSHETIRSFGDALGFDGAESLYFENMVHFNQSKKPEDRKFYLERMLSLNTSKNKQQELLKAQYGFVTHWYYVAIRELVALYDFKEDIQWINARLKHVLRKDQITKAIQDLITLGLLKRDDQTGVLVQSELLVKIPGGVFDSGIQNFHLEMLELARKALIRDEYQNRQASSVTLSCPISRLPELKAAIGEFRDQITTQFGVSADPIDSVIQVCFHIFTLTHSPKTVPYIQKEGQA